MYVETVPNRNSSPAILLRESRREGKSVRKTTIANLTHWPENVVDALRRSLAGEKLVSVEELFDIERTEPYGHVEAVLATIRRLGLDSMIASERSPQEIATKVGKVVGRYKMAKHLRWTVAGGRLEWSRKAEAIGAEAALDGFYVVRTGEPAQSLSSADAVRGYKNLARVERAFRTLKSDELRVRPIRHHTADHVRAHIFLCLLAYYVEWHMRSALAPLLFDDEELATLRAQRDPVAPAQPSASARRKKTPRLTDDGLEVQSFPTLLAKLAKRARNYCRTKVGQFAPGNLSYAFERITDLTPRQKRAFELLACAQ